MGEHVGSLFFIFASLKWGMIQFFLYFEIAKLGFIYFFSKYVSKVYQFDINWEDVPEKLSINFLLASKKEIKIV